MTFPVSDRVNSMKGSSTLLAAQKAAKLRADGISVIDLSVGEPDFDTPQFIKDLAVEGMSKGITKYTATAGLPKFRSAVSVFYREFFGADVDQATIAASCGGKQAIFNAAATVLNPGDEVLLPRPFWVTFPEIVTFCGAKSVFIDTEATDFVLTLDQVKDAITERTKLIILNSPNNPSGRVIPSETLIDIVRLCAEKNIFVITDECYLFFAYPPAKPFSLATLPAEERHNVCVAGSFSKTFAMTGWRIGYTIANAEWTAAMLKLQGHSSTHPTSFVQYACAEALGKTSAVHAAIAEMTDEYDRRREYFVPALNEIAGVKCSMPQGAFYAFADVRGLIGEKYQSSADVADALLNECHIVVTDGEGFGADGFLRLSYATSIENLKAAIKEMKQLFGTK